MEEAFTTKEARRVLVVSLPRCYEKKTYGLGAELNAQGCKSF